MADTMISFRNDELSSTFMSIEELKKTCPKAFCTTPTNPNLSDKYVQATTIDVVNDLAKLGWYPVQAKQCKAKKNSSGIHSFHMIAFQNPDIKINKIDDEGNVTIDAYPRIILTNSHDGFNSFKFMCGMFRLVCSNGLVICDNEMVNMSIRHINYDFEKLRKVVVKAIEEVKTIVDTMNKMQTIILNEEQKRELATEVVKIRKGIEEDEKVEISDEIIDDILTPVREEDKKMDLWTIFNVCQEKMIKGGFNFHTDRQKLRKQRAITSIKKDIDYNQRLWLKATKYMQVA